MFIRRVLKWMAKSARPISWRSPKAGWEGLSNAPCRSLLLVFALIGPVHAQPDKNWPQFRGPNGQGVSATNHALPIHLDDRTLQWKTPVSHGVSCPCVWGDLIFLTGHDREEQELITLCLDGESGDVKWTRRARLNDIPKTHVATSPAAPTIATDGRHVYVYFGLLGLSCHDLDGEPIWHKSLPPPRNRHGAGTSPIVVGDRLFLVCDQGEVFQPMGSFVLCLDKTTGDELWKQPRPLAGPGWSTPMVTPDKQELIVMGRRLIAYDVATGQERWWCDGFMDFALTTPVMSDGLVFAVSAAGGFEEDRRIRLPTFQKLVEDHDKNGDGQLAAEEIPEEMVFYQGDTTGLPGDGVTAREALVMFDGDKNGLLEKEEWQGALSLWNQMKNKLVAIRPGGSGDVTRSRIAWQTDKQLPEVPSPLAHDEFVYLVKNGGIVTCLAAQTGETVYRKRLGTAGNYFASPVLGDGKIYAASDTGVVTVFREGPSFRRLGSSDLGEQIIATPAIVGNKIYIRTAKYLMCFGELVAKP